MAITVEVLDVGHGGCAVVRTSNTTVVVDVASFPRLLSFLDAHRIERVDAVIITHLDADHSQGLLGLLGLRSIETRAVYVNPDVFAWSRDASERGKCLRERDCVCFASQEQDRHCTLAARVVQRIQRGEEENPAFARPFVMPDKITVNDEITFSVLWPRYSLLCHPCTLREVIGREVSRNLLSGAVKFTGDRTRVLIAGDCPVDAVRSSVDSGADWSADVLVYPHHGGMIDESRGDQAADEYLREVVSPSSVIFQNSRRRYNLPRRQAVEMFRDSARILCTGLSEQCAEHDIDPTGMCAGGVRVEVDGRVRTERPDHRGFVEKTPELDPMCKRRQEGESAADSNAGE
jgi:beta-lactamase superfamily II metal-dependent hydrolase